MENFDYDLQSVQEARNLARLGKIATDKLADYTCLLYTSRRTRALSF